MSRALTAAGLVTVGTVTLAGQGRASLSWVPSQADCPIVLANVQPVTASDANLFESAELQNISSAAIDEVTLGVMAGSNHMGTPQPMSLVARRIFKITIHPGERKLVPLQFDARKIIPPDATPEGFLATLGVVQVRTHGQSVWVSAAENGGDFVAISPTVSPEPRRACLDDKRRMYSPGALLIDKAGAVRVCRPDGSWAPR
jgi:hypothetical protein